MFILLINGRNDLLYLKIVTNYKENEVALFLFLSVRIELNIPPHRPFVSFDSILSQLILKDRGWALFFCNAAKYLSTVSLVIES
jgi:hypothetical protein